MRYLLLVLALTAAFWGGGSVYAADEDGDGYTTETEPAIGTDPNDACGQHTASSPFYSQAWPADIYSNTSSVPQSRDRVTIQDITAFSAPVNRYNTSPGDANFHARWDLIPGPFTPGAKWITVHDMLSTYSGATGNPPMFSGENTKSPGRYCSHFPEPTFPIRAAFFYPWFPEGWTQNNTFPYSNYTPTLGYYDSGATATIDAQLEAMEYAHLDAAITSWWGDGHHTDVDFRKVLERAQLNESSVKFAAYYEAESVGDPTPEQIGADLNKILANLAPWGSYLRIDDRPVVFVYADLADGAGMAQRWAQGRDLANRDVYLVLKVYTGYESDPNQPDDWHQYGPAVAYEEHLPHSAVVSPGYWFVGQPPALPRDPVRFQNDLDRAMRSGARWVLVTTWNEYGEGTPVESTTAFEGTYLTAMCWELPERHPSDTCAPAQVVGAGDIAECLPLQDENEDDWTGDQIEGHKEAIVFTAGDNVYEDGSLERFNSCYTPAWGPFKDRTYPSVGNHEYVENASAANGYCGYFGAKARCPEKYYAYYWGAWRVYAINSECSRADTAPGSCAAQRAWIASDAAAHPTTCALAYYHHPRRSGGEHGDGQGSDSLGIWQALYDAGVDLVITGHDHSYQRFAPLSRTSAAVEPNTGMSSFVVGTGGKGVTRILSPSAVGLEAWADDIAAVPSGQTIDLPGGDTGAGYIDLALDDASYQWQYQGGGYAGTTSTFTYTDGGERSCRD